MKKLSIIISIILSMSSSTLWGKTASDAPDFNYPKNVIESAEKGLNAALKAGDGKSTIKYLVQTSLAQSMITTDDAQPLIERIDSVAQIQKDAVTKSILYHFEAKMLTGFYSHNSGKISERKTLNGVTDMNQWSTEQFFNKVCELIDKSLADKDALLSADIYSLGDLIVTNENTHILYPTLYDMLCRNSIINLLDYFGDNLSKTRVNALYASLKEVNAEKPGPYINVCCDIIKNSDGDTNKSLKELYNKYISTTDLAYQAITGFNNDSDKDKYAVYTDFVARYPNSIYVGEAKNQIASLTNKSVHIKFSEKVTSTDSIRVTCEVKNTENFAVYIFKMPDGIDNMYSYKGDFTDLRCLRFKELHIDNVIPFRDTVEVSFAPLPYGRYFVFCDMNTDSYNSIESKLKNSNRRELDNFIVSDMMLFSATTKENEARIFAVNASTGAPLKNVILQADSVTCKTNADGYAVFYKKKQKFFKVSASYGNDILTTLSASFYTTNTINENIKASIFTDLGIYHPGDTVRFTAITYNNKMSVVTGQKLCFEFYDSNYELIDSINGSSDEMGQFAASFVVPSDRLNGNFNISVSVDDDDIIGNAYVTVSDYKVPTFFVETDDKNSFDKDADVVITGKATTYTEMPVANAKIVAELSLQEWSWWRFGGDDQFIAKFETTTAADGSFSITIPKDSLQDTESYGFRFSQYVLNIAVTSDAGETQSVIKTFEFEKYCAIVAENNADFCFNADKDIKLPITVKNSDETETFDCNYTIIDKISGSTVASGSFKPDSPVISLASLKSGEYTLEITAIHDAKLTKDIVIFRPTDKMPPVQSPLWIPECGHSVDSDNKVTVLLGNTNTDSHIYLVATTRDKIVKDGWLKLNPGMHELNFNIPKDEYDFINITFITTYNGTTYTETIKYNSQYKPNSIKIKPVAFRDRLIPGSPERWIFQLENAKGKLVQGAMFCEMYDKGVSQIMSNDWRFAPSPSYSTIGSFNYTTLGSSGSYYYLYDNTRYSGANITYPQLYVYNINPFYPTFISNRRYHLLSKTVDATADYGSIEAEEALIGAAPGVAMAESKASNESANALQEVVEISSSNLDNVVMRTADIQTALWKPSLRTDAEGNIYVEFDAPQFNTTWIMQAIAYTSDLHTASLVKEVVTSKPIMVRANMPRFVRQGDKVNLASSLMNATDSTQTCDAVIELFIPETGEIVATKKFNKTLEAKATKAISIDWNVPDTIAYIGYRVKAATAEFGDGEQTALVVLPSISPIIETKPFFIDASNKSYSLELPKFPAGSRVTLEYCDNPVWYCVTALPSIKTDDNMTATALAHSLYALVLADGIANSNPDIKEAINYWNETEGDSTLVSNLEKNSELKIGTLIASPWLREAERQTLRMKSISDLFDAEKTATETDNIITKLEELQMSDGGWTWFKYYNCQSSLYTTKTVLELIGRLRHLGYIKDNARINAMLDKAISFYDNRTLEEFNKRTVKNDYSGLSDYVYIRSLYKDYPMSATMQKLYSNALKAMKTEWKGLSMPAKAYFAIALHRNNDTATAKAIIESIRQFSITKPETGMYWDNLRLGWNSFYSKTTLTATMLQAFAEIEPESQDIDQIRKWMLLDKQTNDWDNSSLASNAIYAILSSGSKWLGKQTPAEITVGNVKVESSKADQYIGYFKRTLDVETVSKALMSVSRNGISPAWGALYCQYSAPMTEVVATSVDELSIEKETYVTDGNNLVKTDKMKVGDRVQVRFVIKVSRDLEYVTLNDERAACTEPVDQISEYRYLDGVGYYMEIKNDETRLFFSYLPRGTHVITYDLYITAPGEYNVGIATIQSQYAPQITAHSKGNTIKVSGTAE